MEKKAYILGIVGVLACSCVRAVNYNYNQVNEIKVQMEEQIENNPDLLDSFYISIDKIIDNLKDTDKNILPLIDLKVFLKEKKNNEHILSHKEKLNIVSYAYNVLDNQFLDEEKPLEGLLFSGMQDAKLFITLLNNGKIRCCQGGVTKLTGEYLPMGLISSGVKNCVKETRFGKAVGKDEINNLDIVFNYLYNKTQIPNNSLLLLQSNIQLGIHAIQIKSLTGSAFFKESVPISKSYDLKTTLERLCDKAKLDKNCYTNPEVKVYKYDTYTFKASRNGKITDLYRYNVYLDPSQISKKLIKDRVKLSEDWFLNNVNPESKILEYEYYPSYDTYSKDNNDVRQMGALWSMTQIRKFTKSEKLSPLILKTFNHYLKYALKDKQGDWVYFDINGDKKLAYNAFMIFALVDMPEYPNSDEILRLIGNGIVAQQQSDGSYNTFFHSNKTAGKDFYPGEAMLALMKLYEHSKDKIYLESVKKAFPYYRSYWRSNKNTAFIPWHSQVYLLLYKYTSDNELVDFVFEMNDWVIDTKFVSNDLYKDRIGGFRSYIPNITTASFSEGLNDAFSLAKITGNKEYMEKYYNVLKESTKFIMQLQYTDENSFYLENTKRAVGGFKSSLVNNAQRNDHTQHAILAMIKSYNNGIYR